MLQFDGADTKLGRRVINVLRDKHPDLKIPDLEMEEWASFEEYAECQTSTPVDCTAEIVKEVAGKLSRGAEPGSVDAVMLRSGFFDMAELRKSFVRSSLPGLIGYATKDRPGRPFVP